MAPRLYSRLPEGRFRLIKLLPGKWDDQLQAELFEADQTFEYTALSYTWGSRRALRKVTLNGFSRGITVNLDLALRTLRSTDSSVTVWADALCIDQEDVEDKSTQVGLMNDIFGWASQVRACVGDPLVREHAASFETRLEELGPLEAFEYSDDQDKAWEEIHSALSEFETSKSSKMSAHQRCHCIFGLLRALASPALTTKLQDMDLFSKKLTPKMELKQRNLFEWLRIFVVAPWWDRMWITQEVGVARELVLSYGKVTMSFSMLASVVGAKLPNLAAENERVIGLLVTKLKTISELRRLQRCESIAEMRDLDYFQRSLGSPLLWLLRTFRHRHSSEPRDKIYALARLLTKLGMGSKYKLKPDYSTSVATLFCRVAVLIMQETGLFWITSADLVAKSRDNLPSWVPNWTDGFTTPDTENMAWKIRLCHNVSNISFSVEAPLPPAISMEPSKYYSSLAADAESYSWKRQQGGEQKFNEPFSPAVKAGHHDAIMYSKHFFLDRENSEARRIWYEHHEPEVRDFTKIENCLKVPSQFCSIVLHVSEPIAPDLSNLQAIVKGLRAAHYEVYPGGWGGVGLGRLEQIGRVLCFGAVIDQHSGHARRLKRYDDPDLAILVQLLTRADEDLQGSKDWEVWYRQKMLLELRSPCSVCQSATCPCSECSRQSGANPIPSPKEARKDSNIKQLRQTAKQTAPGNCIIMTNDTMALGPPQSQVGDRVSILSGGLCPYILRRDTNPQHLGYLAFQLIGDCFLDKTPSWDTERLETVALV